MPSFPVDTLYVLKERLRSFLPERKYDDFESGYEKAATSPPYGDLDGAPVSQFGLLDSEELPMQRPPLRTIDKYIRPECPCLTKRYTVAVLTCCGFIITFGMRCNMGMAKLGDNEDGKNSSQTAHQLFNWTVATESAVDSSFFWGYLITQVPGGFLASMFPANRIFGTAVFSSACLNMLVPGASKDSNLLIIVRIFQGLVEGVTYPACHGIWRHWAPPLERSRLATLALCGSYAGVVIGMPLSGLFITYIGVGFPFYFYGVMGIIWFLCWNWLVFEKPCTHPTISVTELTYIEKSLGQTGPIPAPPTIFNTPWGEFLHSMPVYAIIVANFCRSWNFYLLVLYQARYFSESFELPVATTGFIGALPHLFMTSIVPSGGLLADHLRKKGILSTTLVRKLFNCGGFGMEAFFFLVVAFSNSAVVATMALTFGVAFSGFAISGFNVNHLDIAPRYASILMGLSNGIGTMAGFILPVVVDYITRNHDLKSWQKVFVLAATVHFVGVCFYGTFASGELQPWAEPKGNEQNQLEEFGNGAPPPYGEVTKKKIRVMKYGSMEQNGSFNSSSRQVSEDIEDKTTSGDSIPETNPFR